MSRKLLCSISLVVSLFALAGCADVCDEAESAGEHLKATACPGATVDSDVDMDSCRKKLETCTDADKEKLSATYQCMGEVPACQAGQEFGWIGQLGACAHHGEGLSSACLVGQ